MHSRIKQLRKTLGITQSEMGEKIGVTQAAIAAYEGGIRVPSSSVVRCIELEYQLTPGWLETGNGPMFKCKTREEEISSFVAKALSSQDSTKELFLWALSQLSENAWSEIRRIAESLLEQKEKPGQ